MNKGLDHASIWQSLAKPTTTLTEVKFWLRKGLAPNCIYAAGATTLGICFCLDHSTQWKEIALLLLLEHGVDINCTTTKGNTVLTTAAQYGSFEQVEFLVNHKANISHANQHGVTPLMFACSNRKDYTRIIPFLIGKGASLYARDKCDRRPLEWAFEWGSTVLELIIPYYPFSLRGMSKAYLMPSCADPARCLLVAIDKGCLKLQMTPLLSGVTLPMEQAWLSNIIVFNYEDHSGVEIGLPKTLADWRYTIANFGSTRFIDAHDGTLLHAACEQNNLDAVKMIVARKAVNPYLRNRDYLTPDTFAKDPAIISLVCEYRKFKPTLQYADWLGPYFVKKAMALLLVNQRLRVFPNDIVLYILGWIAHLDLY